jgi:hypothetical protein
MIIENVGYIHDDLLGGTRPMTNFEFIQTCTMEELAELIFRICYRATWDYNVKIMVAERKKNLIMEWLKEKRND